MLVEKHNSRNFIIGFLIITALFIQGGLYIISLPNEQLKAGEWVTHTHQALNRLETLSLHINGAEASQRGYMLTGDKQYLDLYKASSAEVKKDIEAFQHLTADNPSQQARISELQKNMDAFLDKLADNLAQRESISDKTATQVVAFREGVKLESQIDQKIGEMKAEENRLLLLRMQAWHQESGETRNAFLAGEVLLYLLVCLAGTALINIAAQRKKLIIAERDAAVLQRRKAEHLKEILKVQHEVVGNSSNMQRALQTMADKARELIRAEGCVVEMLDGTDMVYYAGSGSGTKFVGMRIQMEGSFSGLCMRRGSVLRCDDSEADTRVDRVACRKVGLRSMVVVPLCHDVCIGVLKVMSSQASAFSEDDVATLELMAGLLSAALSDVVAASAMRLSNMELSAANLNLEKLAMTDGLTGLHNRRTFQEFLSREYDLSVRHKRQLSLIILDVDHFKKFNDSFGHPAGDAVLQKVGYLLKQLARKSDCAARYGGEEFVLLLPETGPDEAMILARRIQQAVGSEKWEHRQVTVSLGVSSLGGEITNAEELLASADKALYAAKESGRNQAVCYLDVPH